MSDNKFGLGRVRANVEKMKVELPKVLANQAQNFFVGSFEKQGWEGETWKEPKRRIEGTPEYKYPKFKGLSRRTKPTLQLTGALRRAVATSIRTQSFDLIRLVVDLPYAKAQNDGEKNLPKRHYMGDSPTLRMMQRQKVISYIDRLWQA